MNAELATQIRTDFDEIQGRWVDYLLVLEESPYRARARAELEVTVSRSLEAWIQVLEGRDEALREFVSYIVNLRMGLGFPLSDLHRANIGFRLAIEPFIAARYPEAAGALRAYADVAAVCERCSLLLFEEWQRAAIEKIAEANSQVRERAETLTALNLENLRLTQQLSRTNNQLRTILRSVDSAILLVDTDCRVVFANARVQDLLGVAPEALIGRDKREVVAARIKSHFRRPDEYEQRIRWLNAHMEEEAIDEMETVGPKGRWLRRYSAPVRDEAGSLLGRLSVYTDISEERRTQEILEDMVFARTRELQELNQQLVQRERLAAIGELAASVAHELRNPLGIVSNAAYLLRRRLGDDPAVAKTLETLEKHVQRCSHVINDLLNFARSRPLRRQPVDPCGVLRSALREHVIPPNVQPVLEFDEAIEPIMADQPLLEQAVSNLVANALQSMAQTPHGVLRLACRRVLGGVDLVVADRGTGITEEARARIFEPLFTTSPRGTGLGLPLVKRIVEAHEGRISLETTPGAGTTFTVFLPAHTGKDLATGG